MTPLVDLVDLVNDLYDHADGNPGDGCWELHEKYKNLLRHTCKHCGDRIERADLTMQGPRGPWQHVTHKSRRCFGRYSTYAESAVSDDDC